MTPVLNFGSIKLISGRALLRRPLPNYLTSSNCRSGKGQLLGILLAFGLTSQFLFAAASTKGKLEYNRDIRPILAENCFACHGPDSAARKAGLRLDRRDDAIKAGVIDPGHPEKSP